MTKNKWVRRFFFVLFWIVFLLFIYAMNKIPKSISFSFEIAIIESNSEEDYGMLYLDTGNGYNEHETKKIYYSRESIAYEDQAFELPGDIKRLRIDPLSNGGIVEIRKIEVRRYLAINKGGGKGDLIPLHSITKLIELEDGATRVEMTGDDPYLAFSDKFFKFSLLDLLNYILSQDADKLAAGLLFLILFPFTLLVVMSP